MTGEILNTAKRILRSGLPVYRLRDQNNEDIKWTFYQLNRCEECQCVESRKKSETRGKSGNKELHIKYHVVTLAQEIQLVHILS